MAAGNPVAFERARCALLTGLVADSLSLPVHWFYNPADIRKYFGPQGITKLEDAPPSHPSSIMHLHSTSYAGRKAALHEDTPHVSIIGDVIVKGRKQFWGRSGVHYHHKMKAGENTLNIECARLVTRLIGELGRYDREAFLERYISFMQDRDAYTDVYAESFHRGFFANLILEGKPPTQCGVRSHDTPSIGGFVMLMPVIIAELLRNRGNGGEVERVKEVARAHLVLTHPDEEMERISDVMVDLTQQLLFREEEEDPLQAVERAFNSVCRNKYPLSALVKKQDSDVVGGIFSTACYISSSLPSLLYLAYKYSLALTPTEVLLVNTNLGGENCHRGYVLGCLVGLITGQRAKECTQLVQAERKRSEIDLMLKSLGETE